MPALAQVVQELKRECAGRDSIGRRREGSAVAWSLQRYLIFAILACIPGPAYALGLTSVSPLPPACAARQRGAASSDNSQVQHSDLVTSPLICAVRLQRRPAMDTARSAGHAALVPRRPAFTLFLLWMYRDVTLSVLHAALMPRCACCMQPACPRCPCCMQPACPRCACAACSPHAHAVRAAQTGSARCASWSWAARWCARAGAGWCGTRRATTRRGAPTASAHRCSSRRPSTRRCGDLLCQVHARA